MKECCFTNGGMEAEGEVRGFSQLQILKQRKGARGFIPVILLINRLQKCW